MNNYLKILLHLKQFEGDGKYHDVEALFPGTSFDEQKIILNELQQEDLIKYIGREMRHDSFYITYDPSTGERKIVEDPRNHLNEITPPTPLSAKITFKGSKYLKEELEMQQSGKYNITIGDGSTANLILESPQSSIHNQPQVLQKIEEIIEALHRDTSTESSVKNEVIEKLEVAKIEANTKAGISKETFKQILARGAEISSIGSLLASLAQMLL